MFNFMQFRQNHYDNPYSSEPIVLSSQQLDEHRIRAFAKRMQVYSVLSCLIAISVVYYHSYVAVPQLCY
jgi:hypothetical protein